MRILSSLLYYTQCAVIGWAREGCYRLKARVVVGTKFPIDSPIAPPTVDTSGIIASRDWPEDVDEARIVSVSVRLLVGQKNRVCT